MAGEFEHEEQASYIVRPRSDQMMLCGIIVAVIFQNQQLGMVQHQWSF